MNMLSQQERDIYQGDDGRLPIAIDFDGVICKWDGGVDPEGKFQNCPMPGAREALIELIKVWRVIIYSARFNSKFERPNQREEVAIFLKQHNIPYDELSAEKPIACLFVDDKAIPFQGSWPDALKRIKAYE